MIPFVPSSFENQNPWSKEDETPLWLLTPDEVQSLEDGTMLVSIMKDVKIVGHDYIDLDTRFGYTAWGVYEEDFNVQ